MRSSEDGSAGSERFSHHDCDSYHSLDDNGSVVSLASCTAPAFSSCDEISLEIISVNRSASNGYFHN